MRTRRVSIAGNFRPFNYIAFTFFLYAIQITANIVRSQIFDRHQNVCQTCLINRLRGIEVFKRRDVT